MKDSKDQHSLKVSVQAENTNVMLSVESENNVPSSSQSPITLSLGTKNNT
jgi:hypothetical protein